MHKAGIELHRPNPEDPVDVLAKVGGLDSAGMVGLFWERPQTIFLC